MALQQAITTADLLERLRRHYIKAGAYPGGVFVPEVGVNGSWTSDDGRTLGKTRRCDALYVGFTSTSGRLLVGHEVKVSRADWLHELASPGKADAWADQCHAWYVVAPSVEVVKPEELPSGWGLMVPVKGKITRKVKATEHTDRVPAWWAVRSLMARTDTLMEQTIARRVEGSLAARARELEGQAERAREFTKSRHEKLATALERVIVAGGVQYLDPDAIAATVAEVMRDRDAAEQARRALDSVARDLDWTAQHVQTAHAQLKAHRTTNAQEATR